MSQSSGGAPPAPADYIITNNSEWASTMALGAATLAGKVAEVRGALSAVTINALAPASTFTIRGGSGGSIRHLDLTGTVNRITFSGLTWQMTGWPRLEPELVQFGTGVFDNLRWQGCTFRHGYGAGLADFDPTATYTEYTRVDNVQTATTSATRYTLTWQDAARTEGWIEFFNRGAQTVYVAVGGAAVTATVGSPAVAAGARLRITPLNPTTDTHFSILSAASTSQVNARTEIGFVAYLASAFSASGASDVRRFEFVGNTMRDLNNGLKGIGRPSLAIVMDNDFDRIYQDIMAVAPRTTGAAYIFRNLITVPFSRSGIAEGLFGDARDPHGDFFQSFGDASGTIGPIYVGGNRPRRSARRANLTHQGVFFSDNDNSPSYNGIYVVSDMLIGGAVNGINSGEPSFPTGDVFVYGATVLDGGDLVGGTSAVRLNTTSEGQAYIGGTVAQDFLKEGAGFVVDNSLEMNTAASIAALFPNFANLPTAVTRAQVESAFTTAAEASGLGATATANAIDWSTTNHEAVILWANVPSGVAWEDLPGQAIGSVITLPLRKVLNRRTGQSITPGTGVEWRSVASDGVTEVQAWTTSSGTVQPDQFVQIRRTSSGSPLTPLDFDVTINGFLSRAVVTTATAAPAVFHTQSGTGPYFRDPANAVPASTTRMEWATNIYPTGNPAGNVFLFSQESTGCDMAILPSGAVRLTIEDGAGTIVVNNVTSGVGVMLLNQWQEITLDVDQVAGIATLRQNGVTILNTTWTPGGSAFFQTVREISFLGSSTGTNLLPSGWQVEYAECYFTTSGVRSLRKRVDGNAATVNADAWKLGGNAT
jgi:hypothetical protein